MCKNVVALFLLALLWPSDAHAYIDPGASMLLLQLLAAAAAAVAFKFMHIKDYVMRWFGKTPTPQTNQNAERKNADSAPTDSVK
ncbi:MAG: hypothetical protein HQ513_07685 [Rhodospirillales bacterium]|nr:hypothetical protein [Rhodospirillales bacterium]